MKPNAKPPSAIRSIVLYLLTGTLSAAIFAYGLDTGRAWAPTKFVAVDVTLANHPFWFWLTESFWLVLAALSAFFITAETTRLRRKSSPQPATHPQTAAPQIPKPKSVNPDGPELRSTSPGGRYIINVYPEEMRMSLWVDRPELLDTVNSQVLFRPQDSNWSLEKSIWQSESVVAMTLRKYPDGRTSVEAILNCGMGAATIGGIAVDHLPNFARVEQALDEALKLARAKPSTS